MKNINHKARDLKSNANINSLDKIITLDSLIVKLYVSNNFGIMTQHKNISYFDYLQSNAVYLNYD